MYFVQDSNVSIASVQILARLAAVVWIIAIKTNDTLRYRRFVAP